MNKKASNVGFTLIELLAVIIIIIIILAIAVPIVSNIIETVRKEAFKATAYSIADSGRFLLSNVEKDYRNQEFYYLDGIQYNADNNKLDYSGDGPKTGVVILNDDRKVIIAIHNGTYCATKSSNENKVSISAIAPDECMAYNYIKGSDTWEEIAANYDVPLDILLEENNVTDPNSSTEGVDIKIPVISNSSTSTTTSGESSSKTYYKTYYSVGYTAYSASFTTASYEYTIKLGMLPLNISDIEVARVTSDGIFSNLDDFERYIVKKNMGEVIWSGDENPAEIDISETSTFKNHALTSSNMSTDDVIVTCDNVACMATIRITINNMNNVSPNTVNNNSIVYLPVKFTVEFNGQAEASDTNAPAIAINQTSDGYGTIVASESDSIYFDGSNDYVIIPRSISTDFTIEFQFNTTYPGLGTGTEWYGGAGLVDAEVTGYTYDFGTSLNANGQVLAGYGNPHTYLASSGGYNNGIWHNVRVVRIASTGYFALYIDDVLVNSRSGGATAALTAPSKISIGKILADSKCFKGYIKNIRLWNYATSSNMAIDLLGNESGLVAYYKFNEGEGAHLTDYSGNGNHGIIYGFPTWSNSVSTNIKEVSLYSGYVPSTYKSYTPLQKVYTSSLTFSNLASGAYTAVAKDQNNNVSTKVFYVTNENNSIYFDGSNDYVNLPRMIADDFTIEFQFKSDNGSSSGTSTNWYSGAGLAYAEISGQVNDFGISLNSNGQVLAGTGNPDVFLTSPFDYDNNVWHTVRFERTKATGLVSLYIDNVLISRTYGGKNSLTSPSTIIIGRGNGYFRGYIKNFRFWDIVTSSNMASPLSGSETGLKAYYRFNEGTGTVLNDYSINSYDGTVYGTPTWY